MSLPHLRHANCPSCTCFLCPKCLEAGRRIILEIKTNRERVKEPFTQYECPVCGTHFPTYTTADEK